MFHLLLIAAAAAPPALHLDLGRDPALPCPAYAALQSRLAALDPASVSHAAGAATLEVALAFEADAWHLRLERADGTQALQRELKLGKTDCALVAESAALVIDRYLAALREPARARKLEPSVQPPGAVAQHSQTPSPARASRAPASGAIASSPSASTGASTAASRGANSSSSASTSSNASTSSSASTHPGASSSPSRGDPRAIAASAPAADPALPPIPIATKSSADAQRRSDAPERPPANRLGAAQVATSSADAAAPPAEPRAERPAAPGAAARDSAQIRDPGDEGARDRGQLSLALGPAAWLGLPSDLRAALWLEVEHPIALGEPAAADTPAIAGAPLSLSTRLLLAGTSSSSQTELIGGAARGDISARSLLLAAAGGPCAAGWLRLCASGFVGARLVLGTSGGAGIFGQGSALLAQPEVGALLSVDRKLSARFELRASLLLGAAPGTALLEVTGGAPRQLSTFDLAGAVLLGYQLF